MTNTGMSTPLESDQMIGRWEIVEWVQDYDDGRLQRPLGQHLVGFLDYTAHGHVTVMIASADREAFTTGGQWDAKDAELAAAYRSMLSYAGRYELDGDTVVHHVDLSLYPNWVGGAQRRRVDLRDDGTIALEARLEENTPEARTARLVWRRPQTEAPA